MQNRRACPSLAMKPRAKNEPPSPSPALFDFHRPAPCAQARPRASCAAMLAPSARLTSRRTIRSRGRAGSRGARFRAGRRFSSPGRRRKRRRAALHGQRFREINSLGVSRFPPRGVMRRAFPGVSELVVVFRPPHHAAHSQESPKSRFQQAPRRRRGLPFRLSGHSRRPRFARRSLPARSPAHH